MAEVALVLTCVIFFSLLYLANQNAKVKIYEPTSKQVLDAYRRTQVGKSPRV